MILLAAFSDSELDSVGFSLLLFHSFVVDLSRDSNVLLRKAV